MTILGVILAGGASSRMGQNKAFAPLGGRTMIAHVLERLRSQADAIAIACGANGANFASLGETLIFDAAAYRRGPLAGLTAALLNAEMRGFHAIVTAPCDAPFLPLDLASRLGAARGPAIASVGTRAHPTFGFWPVAARLEAERLLAQSAGPFALADALDARRVAFDDEAAFANVNTPADLAAAERRLAGGPGRA